MPKPAADEVKPFVAVFHDRLDRLEARAKACGSNLTDLCRDTKIGRATPDRWRKSDPKTVQLMTELEKALEKREADFAKAQAAAAVAETAQS